MRRLAGIAAVAGTLAFAAPASATTFYAEDGGDGAPPCAQSDPCEFTDAIDAANLEASGTHTVQVIGPLAHDGGVFLDTGVELIGSGQGAGGTSVSASASLALIMFPGSTARNLSVAGTDERAVGLGAGAVLEDASVERSGGGTGAAVGMAADPADVSGPPTRLARVSIVSSSANVDGIRVATVGSGQGRALIEDTTVSAARTALSTSAAEMGDNPRPVVRRSTLRAGVRGIEAGQDASVKVSSSVIAPRTPATTPFQAIRADDAAVTVDQSTLDGAGTPPATAPNSALWITAGGGTIDVRGSIVRNFHAAAPDCGSSLPVTIDSSNVQAAAAGTPCVTGSNNIDADPGWVDRTAGDYRLLFGSPGIDTGHSASPDPDASTLDRANAPRTTDADGDAVPERDMGAFEYQPQAPTAAATASPVTAAAGESIRFDGSGSTDANSGETLTHAWSFDDGGSGTGAIVDHPFATPGQHTATLTVTDSTGRSATATATVTVTEAAAPAQPQPTGGSNPPVGGSGSQPTTTPALAALVRGSLGGGTRYRIPKALRRGVGPFSLNLLRGDWTIEATLLQGRTVVGRTVKRGASTGRTSFSVKLNSRGKRALRRKRLAKLTLRVAVTAPLGEPTSLQKTLTLRR